MEIETLIESIQDFISTLPEEVTNNLEDVEFLVCENLEQVKESEVLDSDPPETMKAVFFGHPLEERGEGEYLLPSGAIILRADAIADEDESKILLMHEIAHALGMTEEEVAQMGLGDETPQHSETNEVQENETSNQE